MGLRVVRQWASGLEGYIGFIYGFPSWRAMRVPGGGDVQRIFEGFLLFLEEPD